MGPKDGKTNTNVNIALDINELLRDTFSLLKALKGKGGRGTQTLHGFEPPKGADVGRRNVQKHIKQSQVLHLQHVGQGYFEEWGWDEPSGHTASITLGLEYDYVTYTNLPQDYIQNFNVSALVNWNTAFAWIYSLTIDVKFSVALRPGDQKPNGQIFFLGNWSDTLNRSISFSRTASVNGPSCTIR